MSEDCEVRELPTDEGELPPSQLESVELTDTEQLLDEVDSDDGEGDIQTDRWSVESKVNQRRAKWWCMVPEIRENYRVVITAWVIVLLGLGCLFVGVALEIINRHVEAIRGLIFFIVAVVLLIPGLYAVTHIYLAAKRVGRVTFSTIPFFKR